MVSMSHILKLDLFLDGLFNSYYSFNSVNFYNGQNDKNP